MQVISRRMITPIFCLLLVQQAAAATTEPSAGSDAAGAYGLPSSVVLWQAGDAGERLFLRGRVVDPEGRPLAGALVALRQADGNGNYHNVRYRARLQTGKDGTFSVSTVLPGQYWGAKHIHLLVRHDSYGQLVTRILFKGDPHLNEAVDGDFAILLEEVRKDGEKVLVGGVELVLPSTVGN
jgi:protocatechuate 3,4-dioxygenase beta subunit